MNLILIGYRGTGKSTVAGLVAERLGWEVVDTDAMIEQAAGKSIADIFLHHGEQHFRDLESAALTKACDQDRTVIAAGGGAVLREENRQYIGRTCRAVWLVASPEAIERRVAEDQSTASRRPQLTRLGGRSEIERLLQLREPFYRECANLVVDTEGKTPPQIVDEIVSQIGDL